MSQNTPAEVVHHNIWVAGLQKRENPKRREKDAGVSHRVTMVLMVFKSEATDGTRSFADTVDTEMSGQKRAAIR